MVEIGTTIAEIPLDKLKINYPGLTSLLLRSSTNPILTKTVFKSRPLLRNKFLYYNNETKKFEGISLHSTYTTFRNLTLITTTTSVLPLTRTLPNSLSLYSQFVYTLRAKQNSRLLLNEQSEFSSKLRLNLLKEISRYFALDYTNLRLNWIQSPNRTYSDPSESDSELILIRLALAEKDPSKQDLMAKNLLAQNTQDINWVDDFDYYSTNETVILTNLKSMTNRTNFELTTKIQSYFDYLKVLFWSIVPEEDFLLAVIVPSIVIISIIVLSVVVVCMLQMCKRQSVSDTKHLISKSNTTESTSYSTKTFERTNPLYKEKKAYMSKGVPVILYEEMSDKRNDEFDENDGENLGSITGSYRSPLIMRNEKPPVPPPPEYTRPAYYTPQLKASESILNELQSMLQQSANIISLTETPKQLSPTKSIKSDSSANTPMQFDNEENNIFLISVFIQVMSKTYTYQDCEKTTPGIEQI
ncbi:dystroglycan isoform X1 [Brachionus plicatilis]|uniref:Dystroglycan isoform X1 n=1 Tax=Brachionus plicatilis TaxID=10195 RepID=A0A3M7RYC0_BRAPC|nr:dystroglycan isoform X1 [Brachionus plicatilis]